MSTSFTSSRIFNEAFGEGTKAIGAGSADMLLAVRKMPVESWSTSIDFAIDYLQKEGLEVVSANACLLPGASHPVEMSVHLRVPAETEVCLEAEAEIGVALASMESPGHLPWFVCIAVISNLDIKNRKS